MRNAVDEVSGCVGRLDGTFLSDGKVPQPMERLLRADEQGAGSFWRKPAGLSMYREGDSLRPYTLKLVGQRVWNLAGAWLAKAYATPEGRDLKLLSLDEKELDGFW